MATPKQKTVWEDSQGVEHDTKAGADRRDFALKWYDIGRSRGDPELWRVQCRDRDPVSVIFDHGHDLLDLIAAHHPDEGVKARVKPKGG